MLVQYAISWHITLETLSGFMMTLTIICGFVPSFIISPFAGVWADRYSRKMLIVLSDSMIAVATLFLAILFMAGFDSIWLLFVASAVRSLGSGIQNPAVGAILPSIVPEDRLAKVNGANSSIQSLTTLLSPIVSAVLISFASMEAIFFIDVITAAIAIFILMFLLEIPTHEKALKKENLGYFEDMLEGLRYIRKNSYIKVMFIFCGLYFVLGTPMFFLTPLQVGRSFGDDVWRLTAIEITFFLGMSAGGFIMAAWGGFKNRHHTMILSNFVIAICTLALGIVPNFWIYLFFMTLIGVASPIFNTPFTVLLQEKVEQNYLGRVFGVMNMLSGSIMPLSMLFYGPIADIVRIEYLLVVTGSLLLVHSYFMLKNRVLAEAGKPMQRQAAN